MSDSKVKEGEKAYYKALLVDKDGNVISDDGTVDISFTDGTALGHANNTDKTKDYINTTKSVTLGETFSVDTIDNLYKEDDETFSVNIDVNSFSNKANYENVKTNSSMVTTITDDEDPITVTLVPVDAEGNELSTSEVKEGQTAYYKVVAKDDAGNNVTDGTVDVQFSDGTATSSDYTKSGQTIQNVVFGTTIDTSIIDDYISDNGETFTVSLVPNSVKQNDNKVYEKVNQTSSVTTTITDGEKEDDKGEGENDTVTIKLVPTDKDGNELSDSKVKEGEKAYYKALLVDKDGNVISDDGTVDISFTDGTATGGSDYDNSSKTVQLGEVFEVPAFEDYEDEPDEKYKVSASNFSHSSDYEHVTYEATVETTIENVYKEKPCPIDLSDDCAFVKQGESKIIKVLENDSGKDLRITSVEQPEHGTVEIVGDGRCLKYTADPAPETCSTDTDTDSGASRKSKDAPFLGTDSFTYTAVDAYGESVTATVNPHIASSTDSRDIYRGDDKSEFIIAGKGNDYLSGGAGDDKYFFSKGDGDDIIVDSSGDDDRIVFTPDMDSRDTLCFKLESDGDLVISYGEDHEDHITVKYQKQLHSIERIEMDDGSYLNSNDIDKIIQVLSASANGGDSDFMSLSSINERQSQECQICWHEGW